MEMKNKSALTEDAQINVLYVRNVGFRKHNAVLLNELSFSAKAGEIVAVVGPNGAGKSTLLRILAGDEQAVDGEIYFAEARLADWPLKNRARHVAVLPQFSLLNFPYTVEQVVALGRIPHTSGVDVDKQIVDEVMGVLDIQYLKGRLYPALSGGEKQRAQLARVFCQVWRSEDATPRMLLLDEPTTALDLGHQQQLMQAVRQIASQGVAVVMVVHDINLAFAHADSVLALQCGETLAYGKPNKVLDENILRQLFNADIKLIRHPDSSNFVVTL